MSPGLKRYVIAAAIVGVHVGVIALLIDTSLRFRSPALPEQEPLYIRYFPPARHAQPPPQERSTPQLPSAQPSADHGASEPAPPALLLPEPAPPPDWDRDAHRAADAVVSDLARREHRKCDDSDKPGSWLPKCKKHAPAFGWSDQHRAGFTSEGLPYVRLGKRCVVVMGLLGCALGALPEANGQLFDGLKDPDRDRSSVPDSLAINQAVSATPHRSPVFVGP
jgi:hypothetical protein